MKVFYVTYRCEVKRMVTMEAKNKEEAHKKFNEDDYEFFDETELDCYDIYDVSINEEE